MLVKKLILSNFWRKRIGGTKKDHFGKISAQTLKRTFQFDPTLGLLIVTTKQMHFTNKSRMIKSNQIKIFYFPQPIRYILYICNMIKIYCWAKNSDILTIYLQYMWDWLNIYNIKGEFCRWQALNGQCHEIFCFWFFSWISFPQASDYTIRAISNFFRKFAEMFAAQGLPLVSTTPVANGKNLQAEKFW